MSGVVEELRALRPRDVLASVVRIALLCTLLAVGWRAYTLATQCRQSIVVVLSGSMEPGYRRGDILLLHRRIHDPAVATGVEGRQRAARRRWWEEEDEENDNESGSEGSQKEEETEEKWAGGVTAAGRDGSRDESSVGGTSGAPHTRRQHHHQNGHESNKGKEEEEKEKNSETDGNGSERGHAAARSSSDLSPSSLPACAASRLWGVARASRPARCLSRASAAVASLFHRLQTGHLQSPVGVGDIIVYSIPDRETPIVHRVHRRQLMMASDYCYHHDHSSGDNDNNDGDGDGSSRASRSSNNNHNMNNNDIDSAPLCARTADHGLNDTYRYYQSEDGSGDGGSGSGGRVMYLTKGDNNRYDDRMLFPRHVEWVEHDWVLGKSFAYIPYLGYVTIALAENMILKYVVVIGAVLFLIISGED